MMGILMFTQSPFSSCLHTITRSISRCICLKKSIMNFLFLTPNNTKFLLRPPKSLPLLTLCPKSFQSFKFYTRTKSTKNHFTKTKPPKNSLLKPVPIISWSFPTTFLSEGIIANLCSTIPIRNVTKKLHHTGNSWKMYLTMRVCV